MPELTTSRQDIALEVDPLLNGPSHTALVHLSDIHFHRYSGDHWDLDADLRHQLLRELHRMRASLGVARGVLVTGDIAFSGKPAEYEVAAKFLTEVCLAVGCDTSAVWVVPGNHDVDREIARKRLLTLARKDLREDPSAFPYRMRDAEFAGQLLAPLAAYNEFAAQFGCDLTPEEPVCRYQIPLGHGYEACLLGLNSVMASGPEDDEHRQRLVLGPCARFMEELDDRVYVTMCHHPLDWLLDADSAHRELRRAAVQLFGHKHRHQVDAVNNSVRIVAGAAHPTRSEPRWSPRFNLLRLSVDGSADGHRLLVEIHPRVWHEDDVRFGVETTSDGFAFQKFHFDLPVLAHNCALQPAPPGSASELHLDTAMMATAAPHPSAGPQAMDPFRALVQRVLNLPVHRKRRLFVEVGLLTEEEAKNVHRQVDFARCLKRARSDNYKLHLLWALVQPLADGVNPFDEDRAS